MDPGGHGVAFLMGMFIRMDDQIPQEHQVGDHPWSPATGFVLIEDRVLSPVISRLNPPVVPDGSIELLLCALLFGGTGDEVAVFPFRVWFFEIPAALPDQGSDTGKITGTGFRLYGAEFPLDFSSVAGFGFGAKRGPCLVMRFTVLCSVGWLVLTWSRYSPPSS